MENGFDMPSKMDYGNTRHRARVLFLNGYIEGTQNELLTSPVLTVVIFTGDHL